MRILIAEDDPISRRLLESTLIKSGFEVVVTEDGIDALAALQKEDAPPIAVLDWMMPGMDGVEVCRTLRETPNAVPTYIILLTAKDTRDDIVTGLDAGADDYIIKPFDRGELHARVRVGVRVVELQNNLAARILELEGALTEIKQLQGVLPICSYCKNIRDDQNYWQRVESYISEHTEAEFSHSICPDCYEKIVQPQLEKHQHQ